MNVYLKNKLVSVGLIIVSFSMLTGCNTVEGTVHGAGQDINSVTRTISTPKHHEEVKHHEEAKHHKNMKKKNSSVKKTTTSKQNKSSQPKTNDTNTSY